jgi:hypothetical protein
MDCLFHTEQRDMEINRISRIQRMLRCIWVVELSSAHHPIAVCGFTEGV